MSVRKPGARKPPSFEQTGKLVARALGVSKDSLLAGFSRVTAVDLPDVVALRQRELGALIRWDDAAYLRWRYHLGPEPSGFQACELWQLRLNGRLIGIVGHEKMQLAWRGRTFAGRRGMDVLIDRSFDESGLGVWLSQLNLNQPGLSLAVGANDNSLGMIERLYKPLPPRKSYVLPLDFRPLLQRVGMPTPVAGAVGTCLNGLAPARDWWKRPKPLAGVQLRAIERFDAALVSPLLSAQGERSASGERIEILRNADLLNWRLFDNPRGQYHVTGAFHQDGCVGYIAYRPVTGSLGSKVLHVIDWQAAGNERHSSALAWRLFDAAIQDARRQGCAGVQTVVRHAASEALLKRLGFLVGRHAPYLVLGLHSGAADEMALAEQTAAWCVTDLSFDSDGCY